MTKDGRLRNRKPLSLISSSSHRDTRDYIYRIHRDNRSDVPAQQWSNDLCLRTQKSSRQPSLSRFTAFLCYCAWSAHKSARFAIGHSCLLLHRAANSKQRNLATVYIKMKNKLLNFYAKNEKEGNYICINNVK